MIKKSLPFLIAFLLGSIVSTRVNYVLAHGGNTNFIHACVGTGVLNQGRVRVISAAGSCNANETPLDWSKEGLEIFGGFTSKDLVGYRNGNGAGDTFDYRFFNDANFSQSEFVQNSMRFGSFVNVDFSNSSFIEVNLEGSNLSGANISGVTWTNTICPDGTNSNDSGNTCEGHLVP